MKHRKGKRILNEYRLAFLEYKGDYEKIKVTPEMTYMFGIANGVDAEHGFNVRQHIRMRPKGTTFTDGIR